MITLNQSRSLHEECAPIEIASATHVRLFRLNMERSEERSLLIFDSRPLDGQCLANSISASKIKMNAVWYSSLSEWRRKQFPRHFAAILMNIGGKDATYPVVAAEIKAITSATDIPTIIMSDSEDLSHIVTALELGARGYIPTSVGLDVCIEAIALSMAGGIFVPASSVLAKRQHLFSETSVALPFNDFFTLRQGEVVEALRRGKANKIIAYELKMQESTVKVHIRSIMRKVKASNRTEVVYKVNDMFPRETMQNSDRLTL
jgi:DNA-binding NarL/FixJ family response regulator